LRYFVQARRWKRESPAKGIHLQEFRGGDSEHGLQYRLSNCWLRHFTGPYYIFLQIKLALFFSSILLLLIRIGFGPWYPDPHLGMQIWIQVCETATQIIKTLNPS
jgi:hypothetical protein